MSTRSVNVTGTTTVTACTLLVPGVDEQLARHVAHLYARDPLVIIEGSISEVDDTKSTEHFEVFAVSTAHAHAHAYRTGWCAHPCRSGTPAAPQNIQSTNWQNVRWKPPPPDAKDMGWRVELRTMEAQVRQRWGSRERWRS